MFENISHGFVCVVPCVVCIHGIMFPDRSWKGRPTLLLIEEYALRKARFDKPQSVSNYADNLWAEIATVFQSKGLKFTPS